MTESEDRLRVFYDGACPSCVRDRKFYERLAGRTGDAVEWVDITGRDEELKQLGILHHPQIVAFGNTEESTSEL